jgi:Carboxypeptidase regulatory-like domain/TonB dependent receptor
LGLFAARRVSAITAAFGLLSLGVCLNGADLSLRVTGNLVGSVLVVGGTPAMGASIQLFNKFQKLIGRTTTNADGQFAFASLPVDIYSIRVAAPSYLPVSRDRIPVRAGVDSLLQIHLATLLSTIQVTYRTPVAGMTDDWKWVLRSSPATRPITRYASDEIDLASAEKMSPRLFSGTRAMFSVSGGDASIIDSDRVNSDLGTGFILSTNILGKHQVQVGGNYAADGFGAMSLCALYTRRENGPLGPAPEIAFSVSQFNLLPGENAAPASTSAPPVRSMAISIYQTLDPASNLHIEYGVVGESIDYLQHTTRASPFARATVAVGPFGEMVASFSDGGRPDPLSAHQRHPGMSEIDNGDELATVANAISRAPQFSYRHGSLELQRTHSYEAGYRKDSGSRTVAVSMFREAISNGRMNVAGDVSVLGASDLVSDGVSQTSIYNIGRYERNGMLASARQGFGENFDFTFGYGRMGGFTAGADQRNILRQGSHNVANTEVTARLPRAGTRLVANYGWMDGNAIVPSHVFTTQSAYVSPGFNVLFRQPLPQLFGLPGRLEFMADLRNLLAQGYLPVNTSAGQKLQLVQAPRSIRGGVSFIF